MLFPNFHMPLLGDGMTIALVAVLHVLLSHGVAIGMVALIVVFEYLSLRRKDKGLEEFTRETLKIVVIIITAVGAVTGAGIWFTLSVLAPEGIGSMLRVFFWPWFVEWLVFTAEVIVILIYYFLWYRMRKKNPYGHLRIGIMYIIAAFFSAFLITGILGFMLTPDGWVHNHNLFRGFFNPTFLPQLGLRYFGGLALGGVLYVLFLVLSRRTEIKARNFMFRFLGYWILIFSALAGVSSWFYFKAVPPTYATHKIYAVLTSALSQKPELLTIGNSIAVFFIILLSLFIILRKQKAALIMVFPTLILSIALVGEFERIREFIRGPYLMPGYMYANQITLERSEYLKKTGFLDKTAWYMIPPKNEPVQDTAGYTLFMANCGACHTIGGINDITQRLKGRTYRSIAVLIDRTHDMVPFMPPFSGTEQEKMSLAAFLYEISNNKRTVEATPLLNNMVIKKGGSHE